VQERLDRELKELDKKLEQKEVRLLTASSFSYFFLICNFDKELHMIIALPPSLPLQKSPFMKLGTGK